MNLKIDIFESPTTADFNLTVQAYDNDQPVATLATLNVDDPNLGIRLREILQAYRMGTMYGQQTMIVAGSELPPRGEGMEDTSVIRYNSGEYPQHHSR